MSNYKPSSKEVTGFPDRDASNDDKRDKKYGLAYARAIYDRYISDDYSMYNRISRFTNNRKYAEGLQDISKYKDTLDLEGDASFLNLDWSVVPIIPKFVDLLCGELMNQKFAPSANAIDDNSLSEFDEAKKEVYANLLLKDMNEFIEQKTGLTVMNRDYPTPETSEEASMYMDLTYKQGKEIAIQDILSYILKANDQEEVQRRIIRDLVSLKWCATRLYFDRNNDIKWRYVDPRNLVLPFSTRPDFADAEYIGEVRKVSFSEIVNTATDLSEEDLKAIVKQYRGGSGVKGAGRDEKGSYYNNNYEGFSGNDDFYVDVLDFEFKSTSFNMTYEKKYYKEDGFFMNKKHKGYEPKPGSRGKREVISKNVEVYYEGFWIVGSEYVYNYGMRKNMPRKKNGLAYSSKTESRYKIYAPDIYDMENKSLVERMIPHADMIQLAYLKLQAIMAKARPKGIAVDISGLEGVMRGRGSEFLQPIDLMSIYDQTGNLYYRGTDPDGGQMNRRPIDELDGGLPGDIMYWIQIYNHNLQMIRDVTGINEFRDGSTPDSKTLVGVQKAAIMVSRNTTRPLNEAYVSLLRRTCDQICQMVQLKALYDKNGLKPYRYALGTDAVKILELSKEIGNAAFGINIDMLPDELEKDYIDVQVEHALINGNIDLEDAFEVREAAKQNAKKAAAMLTQRRRKKEQENNEKQMQLAQANAEAQSQAALVSSQEEMKLEQMRHQFKMEQLNTEYQWKMKLSQQDGMIKGEIEEIKGDQKIEQIKYAVEAEEETREKEEKGSKQIDMPRLNVKPADDAQQSLGI